MRLAPPAAAALAACGALLGLSCAAHQRPRPSVPLLSEVVGAVETYGPGLVATDDSGETVTFALRASAGVAIVRVWPRWRLEALYPARDRDTSYFPVGVHVVQVPRAVPWDTVALPPGPLPPGQAWREEAVERCVFTELQRRQPPVSRRGPADTTKRAPNQPSPADYVDLAAIEAQCRKAAGIEDTLSARDTLVRRGDEYYVVLVASDQAIDARHLREKLAGTDITRTDVVAVLQTLPRFLAGERAGRWAGYAARVGGP